MPLRETVESIVIAFVLAFLFRTFEAEAFVIPTGSMAPTLMGRHKDVDCPKCGYRYEVSASEEESEDPAPATVRLHRRHVPDVPLRDADATRFAARRARDDNRPISRSSPPTTATASWSTSISTRSAIRSGGTSSSSSFPAMRSELHQAPGRLAGRIAADLPGRRFRSAARSARSDEDFKIERKPPDKVLAMRQLVHDTDYDPAELDAAGWPLRWHAPPETPIDGSSKRRSSARTCGNVQRRCHGRHHAWLRYEHLVPTYDVWQQIADAIRRGRQKNPPFARQ